MARAKEPAAVKDELIRVGYSDINNFIAANHDKSGDCIKFITETIVEPAARNIAGSLSLVQLQRPRWRSSRPIR